jgi:hypothetical protein
MVVWGTQPVAGAGVELKPEGSFYQQPIVAQTTTGYDGRFSLENAPAGKLMIYAIAPSNEYWRWTGRPITVPTGGTVDAGQLRLSKRMELLEPPNESTVNTSTPFLRWRAFAGAARYHVDVFDDATGTAVMRQDTVATELVVGPPLAAGRRYQWSVTAYDGSGAQIAYFSAWVFEVRP